MDPESAVQAMIVARGAGSTATTLSAQLDAVAPGVHRPACPPSGCSTAARLRAWARWDARFGILKSPPDVARTFDTTLVGPASRD